MKKLLFTCAMATAIVSASAEDVWMLVTDAGVRVPVAEVGMLVAADDASTFSVVKIDGTGENIAGVTSVSFVYENGPSAIKDLKTEEVSVLQDPVTSALTIMGCKGQTYRIFDVTGSLKKSAILSDSDSKVDVSALAPGIYVLQVGKSTIKFIKK